MLALPNITSFSLTGYSAYYTLGIRDGVSLNVVQRPNGDVEAYTYIGEFRLEMPKYQLANAPRFSVSI